MLNLIASDHTGVTAAAAIFAAVAAVVVASILCFASDEVMPVKTTVAHSRFATANDLRAFNVTSGAVVARDNMARVAADPRPLLGAFRDPDNPKAPPLDLRMNSDKHLISIGCPGSTKTTALAVVNLKTLKRSMVCLDFKGQLYSLTAEARREMGSKIVVVNALGVLPRLIKSDGWNPLRHLNPRSSRFYRQARSIAEAIVEASGQGKEFFTSSAIAFLTAFIMHEVLTNPANPHLRNVRELICSGDKASDALAIMAASDHYGLRVLGKSILARLEDKSSQTTSLQDIRDTVREQTDFLNEDDLASDMAEGGAIDFEAMHDELSTIYFVVPMSDLDTHRKYIRIFISLMIADFFNREPVKGKLPRPLVLLDEFGQLGRLAPILRALTAIRNYHIQLFFMLQEVSQLRAPTAYPNEWTQFFAGSGALVCLQVGAGDTATAELMAAVCGKREVEMISQQLSGGSSGPQSRAGGSATIATQVHDLMRPEDFTRLAKGDGVTVIDNCPPIRSLAVPYHKLFRADEIGVDPYYHG